MIWDKLSPFYDLFETIYNGRCFKGIAKEIANHVCEKDVVLECACGTGLLTVPMAKKCKKVIVTDYSAGMLKQTAKKVKECSNVTLERASILELPYPDHQFDVVVAANVIHLLDHPGTALKEMKRVCKTGGKIIIPTYINATKKNAMAAARLLSKTGVDFKRQFDLDSYKKFFEDLGILDIAYYIVDGHMPCAFAVFENKQEPARDNLPDGEIDWAEISAFLEEILEPDIYCTKGWKMIDDTNRTKNLQENSRTVLHLLYDDLYKYFYRQQDERFEVWRRMEKFMRTKYSGLSDKALSRVITRYRIDDR